MPPTACLPLCFERKSKRNVCCMWRAHRPIVRVNDYSPAAIVAGHMSYGEAEKPYAAHERHVCNYLRKQPGSYPHEPTPEPTNLARNIARCVLLSGGNLPSR